MNISKGKSIVTGVFGFAKRHKLITAITIVLVAGTLFYFRPKPPKPILTENVSRGTITQTLSITGAVTAEQSVDLTFRVPGKLVTLGVQKGDIVAKYQTIATLDERTALKNLRSSLLTYSIQRNTYEQTARDQQAYKPSDALNDTMKRLLENNQYNLDLAVNSVEIQDLARQESILTTPIAGIVTRADVKTAGSNIGVATTFTITDPSSLSFRMEVDEADISKVAVEQIVEVNLNSYPDKTIYLKVSSIDFVSHTTSTGGNAFDVKAKIIEDNKYPLKVGMNGNATITTNKRANVIKIPLVSLIDDNSVYVKKGNTYEKRLIKLGLQSDTDAQVTSGLQEGELLVTDPNDVPKKK